MVSYAPVINNRLKVKYIHYASLSARFNPLHSKTNLELYKSASINKVSTMKMYENS